MSDPQVFAARRNLVENVGGAELDDMTWSAGGLHARVGTGWQPVTSRRAQSSTTFCPQPTTFHRLLEVSPWKRSLWFLTARRYTSDTRFN